MKNKQSICILFLCVGLFYGLNNCTIQKLQSQLPQSSLDSILSPKLLNSERIKMKYGSYGIKVLSENSKFRVSNLYSFSGEKKITRTFALVNYTEQIDSIFLEEHLKILEGQSIGSVFKQNQWKIEKKSYFLGEIESSIDFTDTYNLMGNLAPSKLAVYVYGFYIKKDNKSYEYATISEVYHPDFLTLSVLKKIYPDSIKHLQEIDINEILEQVINKI